MRQVIWASVDGIAEDILTALSRIRWLFVIARNSSFTYKGRAVDIKQETSGILIVNKQGRKRRSLVGEQSSRSR
jgi:hypothetical protein